jgi:hypothetical protein
MTTLDADSLALIDACSQASLALLESNLTPHGILAASRTEAAVARRYTRIFGRDAAICVMAMCGSGVPALEQGAVASLDALAAQQAANGQIPKYVDPEGQDADFWYLGCIDATLWWLIAVDHVRRHGKVGPSHWEDGVARAIGWLLAQEHQHFRLLQQNEASDWADIMPRSGYVLYSNALWYDVKRRLRSTMPEETQHHFNHMFNPFQRDLPEYHRARLLRHYARRGRRDPGLYLSFVNFAVVGDEGDVFGNVLAHTGRTGRLRDGQPHRAHHRHGARPRPVPGAGRAASAVAPARTVAALHGAPPAERRAPVPQRRHLALRRRLLGDGAGQARAGRARLGRTRAACAGQCARRLALHRVVPRQDAGADGHGRAELECGDLPARPRALLREGAVY